jgi:hypothetical protein
MATRPLRCPTADLAGEPAFGERAEQISRRLAAFGTQTIPTPEPSQGQRTWPQVPRVSPTARGQVSNEPVTSFRELNPPPARVVEVYSYMMREQIVPALREIGFSGPARVLRYGRGNRWGTIRFQKDGRAARAQRMPFTANVDYIAGYGRIFELMPVPALDTWWEVRVGQPTAEAAAAVVDAMGRFLIPAIEAALDDPADPPADDPEASDTAEVDPVALLVQPAGTADDDWFADLASGDWLIRFDTARHLAVNAAADPRTVTALIDRLLHDPQPEVRRLIASRVLPLFARDQRVLAALQTAAGRDHTYIVRWAARYALRRRSAGAGPY